MTNELTMAEHLTQQIARDTKKLNRRSSWIIKIMESQWPTYLLPVSYTHLTLPTTPYV